MAICGSQRVIFSRSPPRKSGTPHPDKHVGKAPDRRHPSSGDSCLPCSKPNSPPRFLRIPYRRGLIVQRSSRQTMNPSPDIADHPARILIVDDERHNRQLLEVMLSPEGFLLDIACSGEEALGIIAKQPPDLILLDIMMPGMDGYEVARRIKANPLTRSIPVVMITAL